MSNTVTPVIGNDGFQRVKNSTEQLNELNLINGRVVELSAGTVTTRLLNQAVVGLGTLRKVVGYAPVGFATAATNQVFYLNNSPASVAATALTNSQLLLLPTGARIVNVTVTNNGTTVVGGTTFDLGTEEWNSGGGTGTSNLLAGATLASINSGVTAGNELAAVAPVALGTSGVSLAPLSAVPANTGVSIQVLGSPNTAGDVAVTITYLL